MPATTVLDGLNDEQRAAVLNIRGPVCILAGAGSGKTTTITRRIANQVLSGAFRPEQILAVTFTDKAAGEMRARLERLGVAGVRARTFHSAAFAQLRHLAPEPVGNVMPAKAMALRQIANRLPKPYRFRPASDLATEIEWAKNRRIRPAEYQGSLRGHEPPIPADLMAGVYRDYELGKQSRGLVDFEDLLELAIRMFETEEYAREQFHNRYLAFTVDEFQDVNLLQYTLLEQWLGGRDEICAVGDDYQSIYGFTGASPKYLIELPTRIDRTKVVKLETNYRSTPEVLEVANRLVPSLGGAPKELTAARPSGPAPEFEVHVSRTAEVAALIGRINDLHRSGIALEEMAVLFRTNFASEDLEDALTDAGVPFQVRGAAFLTRPAARRVLKVMRTRRDPAVAAAVRREAASQGWTENPAEDLGEQELTRQNDLGRLVRLAEDFDDGARTGAEFAAELQARFGAEGRGSGVNLLTYHRAKGLEFDAVFLPRLNEGELPFRRARSDDAVAEERRLLYVGITRARVHLHGSWALDRKLEPSRFLAELGSVPAGAPGWRSTTAGSSPSPERSTTPAALALRKWRLERSRADGVPAFVILHDSTLEEIADRVPRTRAELSSVPGIGPAKLERYGPEILKVLEDAASGPVHSTG